MKIIFILVVIAVAIMLFLRNRSPSGQPGKGKPSARKQARAIQRKSTSRPVKTGEDFRCTSIKPGGNACEAAKNLEGKRFLHSDVPHLPLTDCSAAQCSCKYNHHDDRREPTGERRALSGLSTELFAESGNEERRAKAKGRGRRSADRGGK